MEVNKKINSILSIISSQNEKNFNPEILQAEIDSIWALIDKFRGKINDVILNRLCKLITKLSVIVDAYKANMIKFERFKVYLEREKIIRDLNDILSTINSNFIQATSTT